MGIKMFLVAALVYTLTIRLTPGTGLPIRTMVTREKDRFKRSIENPVIGGENWITGYDCVSDRLNFTRVNLASVLECSEKHVSTITKSEQIQVIERMDDIPITIETCRVVVTRQAYRCGSNGYVNLYPLGLMSFPYKIHRDQCHDALKTRELCLFCSLGSKKPLRIRNLQLGAVHRQAHTFAGWLDDQGYCGGDSYTDDAGSFFQAVVTGWVEVMIDRKVVQATTTSGTIHLPTGVRCTLSDEHCYDDKLGEVFWTQVDQDICATNEHKVIFQGVANTTYPAGTSDFSKSIISVENPDFLVSLQVTRPYSLCGMSAYSTEHPKLVIVRKGEQDFWMKKTKAQVTDYDIFAYINSKFVYVDRTIQRNMETLYDEVTKQQCALRWAPFV